MPEKQPLPLTPDELAGYALEAVRINDVDPEDPASVLALDERADQVVARVNHSPELEGALVARANQLVAAEANGGLDDGQKRQLAALLKLQERAVVAEERKKAAQNAQSDSATSDQTNGSSENKPQVGSGQLRGKSAAEAQAGHRKRQKAKAASSAGAVVVSNATTGGSALSPASMSGKGKPSRSAPPTPPPTPPASKHATGGNTPPKPAASKGNTGGNTPPPPPPVAPAASRPNRSSNPSSAEAHKRGGETLPKEVDEWEKVKQELSLLKAPSAERLLAIYNAVRRSAKWDDDAKKWRHVKSFTWVLDTNGKWTSKEVLEDFDPPRRNGRTGKGKDWTEQNTNDLISEVVNLSEPREHIVTDPNMRKRFEEIMWAKFLSPAHTDRTREAGKRSMFQQAVAQAQSQGLVGDEAIARANRDLYDVAYNAIKARAKADGKSDSDAEAIARKETPKDFTYEGPVGEGLLEWETDIPVEGLRRTDFAKVQATVEAKLHDILSGEQYSEAYGALSDLLSMSRPEDMKAILTKIVGGHTEADARALAGLVDAAQISAHGRRATKIKEQAKEFLPNLMKQFNKSREGIWQDNASYETREHIFAQYEELTGRKIHRSWKAKSTSWNVATGKVDFSKVLITNYDPVQMDEALATVKLQVLANVNLHDDLIALHNEQQRKGFVWMNPALAALHTTGVRQFGVRDAFGHLQEPILGSQMEQMHNSGFLTNRYGYHNDFLNYLNLLAEDVSRNALADWTNEEGWWFYVNHGPGTGDRKSDEARRQREYRAQEEIKAAADARRKAYDGIWQSTSIETMMPQWYLGRRQVQRSSGRHP